MMNISKGEMGFFDKCKSCGRSMRTIESQMNLIAAFPNWGATTAKDIRNVLLQVGVHDLCEAKPGYCEYCSSMR